MEGHWGWHCKNCSNSPSRTLPAKLRKRGALPREFPANKVPYFANFLCMLFVPWPSHAVCSVQCAVHGAASKKAVKSRFDELPQFTSTYDSVTAFFLCSCIYWRILISQARFPTPTVPRPAQPNPHDKSIRVMIVGCVFELNRRRRRNTNGESVSIRLHTDGQKEETRKGPIPKNKKKERPNLLH